MSKTDRNIGTTVRLVFLLTFVLTMVLCPENTSGPIRFVFVIGSSFLASFSVLYALQAVTGVEIFEPMRFGDNENEKERGRENGG